MLSLEQKAVIPRTTRQRWDEILHEDYFGYEMVKDYIADFDHIKEVLTNKHIKQGMRFMCALSYGYKDVVASVDNGKKVLREHSGKITFVKYHLLDATDQINILSDGGSENKGSLLEWINQINSVAAFGGATPPVVRKLTAKTDEFPFSNSMAESTHSIYKSEFLQKKFSLNMEEHFKHLDEFMEYYNHKRYPFEHFGLTPYEVLEGELPNKFRFRELIKNRQKERLEENRTFNCPVLCIQ